MDSENGIGATKRNEAAFPPPQSSEAKQHRIIPTWFHFNRDFNENT